LPWNVCVSIVRIIDINMITSIMARGVNSGITVPPKVKAVLEKPEAH